MRQDMNEYIKGHNMHKQKYTLDLTLRSLYWYSAARVSGC